MLQEIENDPHQKIPFEISQHYSSTIPASRCALVVSTAHG